MVVIRDGALVMVVITCDRSKALNYELFQYRYGGLVNGVIRCGGLVIL